MNAFEVSHRPIDGCENPILGTWKLQSLVFEATATGRRFSPFGDHPVGYLSYSPDGRMYAIGAAEDRPKPCDLVPTDEEKAKLQESIFAYAGTYTLDLLNAKWNTCLRIFLRSQPGKFVYTEEFLSKRLILEAMTTH